MVKNHIQLLCIWEKSLPLRVLLQQERAAKTIGNNLLAMCSCNRKKPIHAGGWSTTFHLTGGPAWGAHREKFLNWMLILSAVLKGLLR